MNDLEYRRKQLLKLQDAVIDLEDLSTGVSIADLTLTDFRIDLAEYIRAHPGVLEGLPLSASAVTTTSHVDVPPGIIFCLRAEGDAARRAFEPGYPLAPHYLVHVADDGVVLLPFPQAKQILDRLKRVCVGRDLPDAAACARFDKATRQGEDSSSSSSTSTAKKWHLDHLLSFDLGGSNHLSNRVPACPPCNEKEKREMEWIAFLRSKCSDKKVYAQRLMRIENWRVLHASDAASVADNARTAYLKEVARVAKTLDKALGRLKRLRRKKAGTQTRPRVRSPARRVSGGKVVGAAS